MTIGLLIDRPGARLPRMQTREDIVRIKMGMRRGGNEYGKTSSKQKIGTQRVAVDSSVCVLLRFHLLPSVLGISKAEEYSGI